MNNFNQSSTGVNVEIDIHRDNDLSRDYFGENFDVIGEHFLLYKSWGNFDKPKFEINSFLDLCKDEVIKGKEEEAKKLLLEYCSEEEIKEYLSDYDNINEGLYYFLTENFEDEDIIHLLKKEFPFRLTEIKGYSQGDYCYIIVPNCKNDCEISDEGLINLVYDSPLRVTITVNDKEFSGEDLNIDEYDDEIDEVKTKVKKGLLSKLTEKEYKEVIKMLDKFTEIEYNF